MSGSSKGPFWDCFKVQVFYCILMYVVIKMESKELGDAQHFNPFAQHFNRFTNWMVLSAQLQVLFITCGAKGCHHLQIRTVVPCWSGVIWQAGGRDQSVWLCLMILRSFDSIWYLYIYMYIQGDCFNCVHCMSKQQRMYRTSCLSTGSGFPSYQVVARVVSLIIILR